MNDLITQLCELRQYRVDDTTAGLYRSKENTRVFFYYVDVLTQEYLNSVLSAQTDAVELIIFCEKQKKLRTPLELLPNVEVHNIHTLRHQLVPNKFCPRFARLEGKELEQLQVHAKSLPLLLTTDPMAQIYKFRANDIVKIYRLDGSLYFRRVIAS